MQYPPYKKNHKKCKRTTVDPKLIEHPIKRNKTDNKLVPHDSLKKAQ